MEPTYVVEITEVAVERGVQGNTENQRPRTRVQPLRSASNAGNRPSCSSKVSAATGPAPSFFATLTSESDKQFIKTIQATQSAQFRQTQLFDLLKSDFDKTKQRVTQNASTLTVHETRLDAAEGQIEQLSQKQLATEKALGDLQIKVGALCDGARDTTKRNAEGSAGKVQAGSSAAIAKKTFVDSSGRKRKSCTICGHYFSAKYVKRHEAYRVCLKRLGRIE